MDNDTIIATKFAAYEAKIKTLETENARLRSIINAANIMLSEFKEGYLWCNNCQDMMTRAYSEDLNNRCSQCGSLMIEAQYSVSVIEAVHKILLKEANDGE